MASPSDPSAVARRLLDLASARPPTLGSGRLVCVDGPGGSGKSTLAAAIAGLAPGAVVLHMDHLYDGWAGLAQVTDQLDTLLPPLARGESGCYRRYDWHAEAYAETVPVAPAALLVLEGVGSGSSAHADLCTLLVWVTAPSVLRLERGLARDGEHLRQQWGSWMRQERDLFARERTADRADVVVDGTGAVPPVVRDPRETGPTLPS